MLVRRNSAGAAGEAEEIPVSALSGNPATIDRRAVEENGSSVSAPARGLKGNRVHQTRVASSSTRSGTFRLTADARASAEYVRSDIHLSWPGAAVAGFFSAVALLFANVAPASGQCTGCLNASFGSTARSFAVPSNAQQVYMVSADFNGDGIPDLATVSGYSNPNVTILLGTGSGGFAVSTVLNLPGTPFTLAAGDLDGDQKTDLVVTRSNGLTLLFGDGAGGIRAQSDILPGSSPIYPVIADVNGDGRADIIVGSGNSVLILPGNGDGTFGAPVSLPANSNWNKSLVADFNGDGVLDLAVSGNDGVVDIFLGSGGGAFQPAGAISIGLQNAGASILTADLDGDGIADLSVGTAILMGLGDGSFEPPQGLTAAVVGFADFNHDGIPDALATNPVGLRVLFGDGHGGFLPGPFVRQASGGGPGAIIVQDFDGDGNEDLALARADPGDIVIVRGIGGGQFEAPAFSPVSSAFASFAVADFNGDGRADIAIVDNGLAIRLSNGDGTFGPPIPSSLSQAGVIATGDFNGDGRADVVASVSDSMGPALLILLGDGTGHLGPPARFALPGGATFILVADFNGDKKPDIVVIVNQTFGILLNDGFGGLGQARMFDFADELAVADINGDGRLDIVVLDNNQYLRTYLGDGAGGFASPIFGSTPTFVQSLVLQDMNGDGKPDLIVVDSLGSFFHFLAGDGAGAFGPDVAVPIPGLGPFAYTNLAAGDFNGDGRMDIAVFPGYQEDRVLIFRLDPVKGFQSAGTFLSLGGFGVVGDFNGDGKPDIAGLSRSNSAPGVWVLLNTSCLARRLSMATDVSTCNVAGAPFSVQPAVRVLDDGENAIPCDSGTVTASLAPGTGTPGATLSGTTAVPAVSGLATFTNLSVNLPGGGYRVLFTHSGTNASGTREFSQSLAAPVITLPPQSCTADPDRFEAAAGYDSYLWTLDAAVVGRSRVLTLAGMTPGSHALGLTVTQDGCSASGSVNLSAHTTPSPPVASNNGPVPFGGTIQLSATAVGGATYQWSGPDGFTSQARNPTIPAATPARDGIYSVVAVVGGCASARASTKVTVTPSPVCAGCAKASFGAAPRSFAAGSQLTGIARGDFDGDGNLDVVVSALNTTGFLTVFPGDGRGSFGDGITSSVGIYPQKILAADLNADGLPDLVLADNDGILTALAIGGGHFASATRFLSGIQVRDMALGDFNEDGAPDLALINQSGNSVAIMLGNGAGGFLPAVSYAVGTDPTAIAVFDLNHDGHQDIAVTHASGGGISILLGTGVGTFGAAQDVPAPTNVNALAIGDLDGDGIPDIVVGSNDFSSGTLSIYAGTGTGAFTLVRNISIPLFATALQVADLRGSGKNDILVLDNDLIVLAGKGGFDFDPAVAYPAGASPVGFVLGDFDRDGRLDAVFGEGYFSPSFVVILRGSGSGTFLEPPTFPAGPTVRGVVAADFNHDGHPDVAVVNAAVFGTGSISVLLNDGLGSLGPPSALDAGPNPVALVSADFNGDGVPDLAVATDNLRVFLANGAGGFAPSLNYPIGASALAVGDFNGDGKKDLAALHGSAVSILLGDGAGHFTAAPDVTTSSTLVSVLVADFNNDGKDDLAVIAGFGVSLSLSVYLGTGTGSFGPPTTVTVPTAPLSGVFLAAGDFNGDGKLDLAVATDQLWILLGNGSGGMGVPSIAGQTPSASGLLAADFNGDGKLDLAVALGSFNGSGSSNQVSVFMGNGTGGFASPAGLVVAGDPLGLAVADFDGDLRPDLVVGNYFPGGVTVLSNTNCVPSRLGVTSNPSCAPAGQLLDDQPVVEVLDDGGNVVACAGGAVTATILPGTGTAGAVLHGTTTVNAVAGVATFSNLSIDQSGAPYQLAFSHPIASAARSLPFSVGNPPPAPVAGSNSPVCEGHPLQLTAAAVPGATYHWTGPNGFSSGQRNPILPDVTTAASGDYSVTLSVDRCSSSAATTTVTVRLDPAVKITAPASVCPSATSLTAAVPAIAGAAYSWSITNGTITSGLGTESITFTSGTSGSTQLAVTVTATNGCSSTASKTVAIVPGPSCAKSFFLVTPCRVADTRNPSGQSGGPALAAGAIRSFPVAGICGIPSSAAAVAINLAVVGPTSAGDLAVYPADQAAPLASSINFRAGVVRANNAIIPLGFGAISVKCDMPSGGTHFFFDVYGYFE
jgi:PKD-like domain/FG-GAP-like repeat